MKNKKLRRKKLAVVASTKESKNLKATKSKVKALGKTKKVKNPMKKKQQAGWIIEDDTDDIGRQESDNEVDLEGEDVDSLAKTNSSKTGLDIEDYDELGDGLENELGTNPESENDFAFAESIQAISSTKRRPVKRKEAGKLVEEFVAVKRRINVEGGVNKFLESVKETGETKVAEKVSKLISVTENSKSSKQKNIKTLDAPAERITSEKIKRSVLYDHAKDEVSKWNSVVYHNRNSEQLIFPLSEDKKAFKKPRKDETEFTPVTPLEEEIAKVLYGEDYVQRKKAEMAKDPEKTDVESYLLNVEEALATHSEQAKLRALQSYAMSKAKRQNKIKSKKYHRLLRKSKIKQQMKDFEELQQKDPDAAILKLEELERSRIQERMSLKHRNTSKWAKMQVARAKYNKDSRIALSEQLKISRDLTTKVQESSDDEDEDDMELPQLVRSSVENPWMLKPSLQENEKLQKYYTGYKKFWEDYNRQLDKKKQNSSSDVTSSKSTESGNIQSVISLPSKSTDGDINEIRDIVVDDLEINMEARTTEQSPNIDNGWTKKKSRNLTINKSQDDATNTALKVNPDNFLKISKSGSSIAPQFSSANSRTLELLNESESSDDETTQRKLIAEAFEDDDIVDDFRREKDSLIEASKPQDIDTFIPGWGTWTGKNITPDLTMRQKFIKKAKKGPPRKDSHISHVIINDVANDKVRAHQVKEVPFPFTRVKDFEKTVRAPIGRTWMPEHAVKSLTAPKVITRLGSTIKPISDSVLVKPKDKVKKFHVPNTILRMAKVTSRK